MWLQCIIPSGSLFCPKRNGSTLSRLQEDGMLAAFLCSIIAASMNHESSLINITGTTAIMLPFNLGLEHSSGVSQICCLLLRRSGEVSTCFLAAVLVSFYYFRRTRELQKWKTIGLMVPLLNLQITLYCFLYKGT